MPLTQKDIARMVGVAESTVSRALNGKPGVGEKTRQQILKIAREKNYKPNQLAQGLAKNKTHMLALFLSQFKNSATIEIIDSIENKANAAGYQIILCNTGKSREKEESYFELMQRNIVDGAIIVGGELADKNLMNIVLDKKTPVVVVNRLVEELLIPTILIDSSRGGYLAGKHLLEQGLERIGVIMGSRQNFLESEKLNGFFRSLKEKGISPDEELVFETEGKRKEGQEAFFELMNLENPPQGFFVTQEVLAAGLIENIKMGGYLVPHDFPVTAYGNTIISSIINPSLTVISDPLTEVGQWAAEYLIKLIEGEEIKEMIKVLEPELVVRGTSLPEYGEKE